MKEHILAALAEMLERWEQLLAGLSEEQITAPQAAHWSLKDDMAHLWAWQQRSIARLQAAAEDREPRLPVWLPGVDAEDEGNTDRVNGWIYDTNRGRTWPEVHDDWRDGFARFLELGARISERDLLDAGRYPWLEGYPLAFVLVASYDHHQEHLEKALDRLGRVPEA